MQALTEVVPNYLASYLCWYYSDPNKRISWDELCKSDANFRSKSGGNKTEDFAEQNWLIRDDVQKAMIIYLQYMKRYNFMKRYQEILQPCHMLSYILLCLQNKLILQMFSFYVLTFYNLTPQNCATELCSIIALQLECIGILSKLICST